MKFSEVIIIGGGPAGSTCAWKLKQSHKDCILLESQKFPRTKLCAGWITPEVINQLELSDYPNIQLNENYVNFFGIDKKLKSKSYAIRRYEFDDWLLKRSGVDVYHHKVRNIKKQDGFYVIVDVYKCKYLVGAGGSHCPVYISFFKAVHPKNKNYEVCCLEEEIKYDYKDKASRCWFYEHNIQGYSWCISKNDGYLNIGVGGLFKGKNVNIKDHWDQLVNKLDSLNIVKNHEYKPKGYVYQIRDRVDHCRLDNAFIIGDAAGLATTDLGEGIGPAVESAICAADAIINKSQFSLHSIHKKTDPVAMGIMLFLWRMISLFTIKRRSRIA
jgi:flavin-dependent dehydrogenase